MAETNLKKNKDGYGYKYTELAEIHNYLEENNVRYYQYVERIDDDDYIYTVPIIDGVEQEQRRGCRVVQATLQGVKNPAQEQGSALTYARRYSLLMAFGLATEDDDASNLSKTKSTEQGQTKQVLPQNPESKITEAQAKRIFAIAKGNQTLILETMMKYGYSASKDIKVSDYEKIVNEIQERIMGGNV